MRHLIVFAASAFAACGGSQSARTESPDSGSTTATTTGAAGWEDSEARASSESEQAAPERPQTGQPTDSSGADAMTENDQPTGVQLQQSLASYCKIALPNAFFEYDSDQLRARGVEVMDKLAACLRSDGLRGQAVRVIGHADPRGSDGYNERLGRSRAQTVADHLAQNGVPRQQIRVESMGEASASDRPSDYVLQRRVDIRLERGEPSTDSSK